MKEGWSQSREEKVNDEPVPASVHPQEIISIIQGLEVQLAERGLEPLENLGTLEEHEVTDDGALEPDQAKDLNETLRNILPK